MSSGNKLFSIHPWNRDLWNWLESNHASSTHAWLFSGPPGLGRHQVALALAERLLVNDDRTRQLLQAGSHPDLHVIMPEVRAGDDLLSNFAQRYFDAQSSSKPKTVITVDQVRTLLQKISTRAHSGDNKMIIITPAERMNLNAANALLKLLEEPPAGTLFVLVSDRANQLPATVRSRTSRVPFRPPPQEIARHWLLEQLGPAQDVAALLTMANGAPLMAMAIAADNSAQIQQQINADLSALWQGSGDPIAIAARWYELGPARVLPWLQRLLCDLVRAAFSSGTRFYHQKHTDWLHRVGKNLDLTDTYKLYDRLGLILTDLDGPLDQRLLLEDLVLELRALHLS